MEKNLELLRLYDLPKGAEIHGMSAKLHGIKETQEIIVQFDHVDGMYSYNYVLDLTKNKYLDKEGSPAILHLANTAVLKKVEDHYEMATEEEARHLKI